MWNLPNILTVARLCLLPIMVLLLFQQTAWAAWTCLFLYIIGALTDFLDGWIARKYNLVTPFGTFLDPISDKIYVGIIMIALIAAGHMDGFACLAVMVIMAREFLVSGLREYLGPYNVQMPVTKLAKWKTATQMMSLAFLIVGPSHYILYWIGLALLLAATALTVVTGWGYLKTGLAHMKGIS